MSVFHPQDWTTTRKSCVRPCVGVLCAVSAVQFLLAAGAPLGAMMWGGEAAVLPPVLRLVSFVYAMACLAMAGVLLERAEMIGQTSAMPWKILAWAVPALSGFAMTGHLLSPSSAEQALMGGATAFIAVMSLFVAFSPDDADMVDNAQMTGPSEP